MIERGAQIRHAFQVGCAVRRVLLVALNLVRERDRRGAGTVV